MIPASAASKAPESEVSSHGCATAVGIGAIPRQRAINASYFSCWRRLSAFIVISLSKGDRACAALGALRCFGLFPPSVTLIAGLNEMCEESFDTREPRLRFAEAFRRGKEPTAKDVAGPAINRS
jgi:hypothetical protein